MEYQQIDSIPNDQQLWSWDYALTCCNAPFYASWLLDRKMSQDEVWQDMGHQATNLCVQDI